MTILKVVKRPPQSPQQERTEAGHFQPNALCEGEIKGHSPSRLKGTGGQFALAAAQQDACFFKTQPFVLRCPVAPRGTTSGPGPGGSSAPSRHNWLNRLNSPFRTQPRPTVRDASHVITQAATHFFARAQGLCVCGGARGCRGRARSSWRESERGEVETFTGMFDL